MSKRESDGRDSTVRDPSRNVPRGGVPTVRPDEAAKERRRLEEESEAPPAEGNRWWRIDPGDPFVGIAGTSVATDEPPRQPRRVLPGPGIPRKG
jgi:hypothetical protein